MRHTLAIVFGTRPELIKLLPVITELKSSEKFNLILININQQPLLLKPLIESSGLKVDYNLSETNNTDLTRLLHKTIGKLGLVIRKIQKRNHIEFLIAQGDTNSVLASAIVSGLNNIKFAHVEAGLRSSSFNDPFPEEFNRVVATAAAFIHFTPTDLTKNNLLLSGIKKDQIIVCGNTGIDNLMLTENKTRKSSGTRNQVLITQHRRGKGIFQTKKFQSEVFALANEHPELHFTWVLHPSFLKKTSDKLYAVTP